MCPAAHSERKPNAGEDTVTQPPGDVTITEGGQVTLDCQFQTSYEANDFPKFMLGRFSSGSINATGFEERFDALLDKDSTSVPLTIQRLQPSYSAVYYCALRDKDCDNSVTTGYTTLREPGVSSFSMIPKVELKKMFHEPMTQVCSLLAYLSHSRHGLFAEKCTESFCMLSRYDNIIFRIHLMPLLQSFLLSNIYLSVQYYQYEIHTFLFPQSCCWIIFSLIQMCITLFSRMQRRSLSHQEM
uniref:Ig-like domain-containing protein n=1 Tax=Salmo trutta TaxID=8032 RepID=A0A674BE15_SALTR